MNSTLQHLDDRLQALEKAVLAPGDSSEAKLIDSISSINSALNSLAIRRERVNQIFKKVPDIQEYLKPGFAEKQKMSVSAQREYLLLVEDQIREMAGQFQRIQELSAVLDSEKIRDFQKHAPRASDLHLKQLDQLDETNHFSEEVAELMDNYNKLTLQLSQHFVEMDKTLTNLERKKLKPDQDE